MKRLSLAWILLGVAIAGPSAAVEYGVTPTVRCECRLLVDGSAVTGLAGNSAGLTVSCDKDETETVLINNGNQDAADFVESSYQAGTYTLKDATSPNTLSGCFSGSPDTVHVEASYTAAKCVCSGPFGPHFNFDAASDTVATVTSTGSVTNKVDADIESVNEVAVSTVDDFKADTTGLSMVALPAFQARPYEGIPRINKPYYIARGSTPTVPCQFGTDYTGWNLSFAVKKKFSDATYAIDPTAATWSQAWDGTSIGGEVYLDSTATDLETGTYWGEWRIDDGGGKKLPLEQFKIEIVDMINQS